MQAQERLKLSSFLRKGCKNAAILNRPVSQALRVSMKFLSLLFISIILSACSGQTTLMHTAQVQDGVPVLKKAYPPVYPAELMSQGVEGWVVVGFSVSKKGRVVETKIIDQYPKYQFFQPAIDSAITSVKKSVYTAASKNGNLFQYDGMKRLVEFKLSSTPRSEIDCDNSEESSWVENAKCVKLQ